MRIFRTSAAACLVALGAAAAGLVTGGTAYAVTSQSVAGCSAYGSVTAFGNVSCTAADSVTATAMADCAPDVDGQQWTAPAASAT